MNFVLTENNSILLGPIPWNRYRFENALEEELEITTSLPAKNTEFLAVNDTVKFYPVTIIEPAHNQKIQTLVGPVWSFTETHATGTYTIMEDDPNVVKSQLKSVLATNRYNYEVAGVKVTVQGQEVTVDTSRDGRNVFVQQYLLMGASDEVQWKFPETWLVLTKNDLWAVVDGGATHIRSAFEWEATKIDEINACTTLAELDAVILTK